MTGAGALAWIGVGAVLAGLLVLQVRRRGPEGELRILAVGLAVAALVYVPLSLRGAGGRWILGEAAGVVAFGAVALVAVRLGSARLLGLGWAVHVIWDAGLHLWPVRPWVGPEYPFLCVGFDLLLAGYLLAGSGAAGRSAPGRPTAQGPD